MGCVNVSQSCRVVNRNILNAVELIFLRRYNQQSQHLFIELCRLKLIRFTLSTSCVKVSTRVTYSYRIV